MSEVYKSNWPESANNCFPTGPTSLALNLKSHTHISPHCQRSKNPGKTQHDDSTKQWLWPGWNAVAGCLRLVVGKLHHLRQLKRTRKYQEPSQLPWGLWYMNYHPALKKAHSYRDPEPQAKSFSYRYCTYVIIYLNIYIYNIYIYIYIYVPPPNQHIRGRPTISGPFSDRMSSWVLRTRLSNDPPEIFQLLHLKGP